MKFLQSCSDFPVMVSLGDKAPSWGLSRWNGRGGLRFKPLDDDCYTLRSDNRQILYKGFKRSHRFTLLCDSAFEYDCILNREPESNVISLVIEGAEKYDFFRQPDFVKDPFDKGSYAVYKKETLLGEGTGKLCHIHRPEIIDAAGRRCWGELEVVGNLLNIFIPEKWLGDAKYPVVVDPTIGTTSIGRQTYFIDDDGEERQLLLDMAIGVNRFTIADNFVGEATAYVYAYETDFAGRCMPVFYSESNNKPQFRRSKNEGLFNIAVNNANPAGWRSASVSTNSLIPSGSYLWFGLFSDFFYPRFDYGAKCYAGVFWEENEPIHDIYPHGANDYFYDYKLSMYFTYTAISNYIRTISQTVKVSDKRKNANVFKRGISHFAGIKEKLSRLETFYRECFSSVSVATGVNAFVSFFWEVKDSVMVFWAKYEKNFISRKCDELVQALSGMGHFFTMTRRIKELVENFDFDFSNVLFVRSIDERVQLNDYLTHCWSILRNIHDTSDNTAETERNAEYYRFHSDRVRTFGTVFRGLLIFVRLLSTLFVRDYVFPQFLRARQELNIKSIVSREITLESRIN